jgi:SAM-dependent methyltransferase
MTLDPNELRAVYGGAARTWAAGPATMYEAMASPLVTDCPIPLAGATVLDFGAGTGATSRAVETAGAQVVAADLSFEMLEQSRRPRSTSVNANVLQLPLRSGTFDAAVGAFVISHVSEPVRALREVARTVRAGGAVLTVGFDARWDFPPKQVIDKVLTTHGMTPASWYGAYKNEVEPLTAFPDRLAKVARDAGLVEVAVHQRAVDLRGAGADGIIRWRLGSPMFASYMSSLDDRRRATLVEELRNALGPDPEPLIPELLVLVARVDPRTSN